MKQYGSLSLILLFIIKSYFIFQSAPDKAGEQVTVVEPSDDNHMTMVNRQQPDDNRQTPVNMTTSPSNTTSPTTTSLIVDVDENGMVVEVKPDEGVSEPPREVSIYVGEWRGRVYAEASRLRYIQF